MLINCRITPQLTGPYLCDSSEDPNVFYEVRDILRAGISGHFIKVRVKGTGEVVSVKIDPPRHWRRR